MTNYNEIEKAPVQPVAQETAQSAEKVVRRKVKPNPKKNLVERLVVGIIGPDGIPALGTSIKEEVIIPAIKNMVSDSVRNVTDLIGDTIKGAVNVSLFGDAHNPHVRGGRPSGRVGRDYNSISRKSGKGWVYDTDVRDEPKKRNIGKYADEFVIAERSDAVDILEELIERVHEYKFLSVASYKEIMEVDINYTDNNFGWKGPEVFDKVSIHAVRGGFIIKLPPIVSLV
jgi:hypothetical protein